jgi:hypothetical protein
MCAGLKPDDDHVLVVVFPREARDALAAFSK